MASKNSPSPAADFARRFGGVDRLYGTGSLAQLAQAHVCVIGLGGVGSWAVEALARSGVGRLTLIDMDHVVTLVDDFIDQTNVATRVPADAAVLDAIDNVRAKAALLALCRQRRQTVVTTGAAGGRIDPTRVEVVDLARTVQDVLASKVRAKLRKDYGFPRDPKKKFGIECVFSAEPVHKPTDRRVTSADLATCELPVDGGAGLACAGYGSSVMVTASFGFAAAARVIKTLLATTES